MKQFTKFHKTIYSVSVFLLCFLILCVSGCGNTRSSLDNHEEATSGIETQTGAKDQAISKTAGSSVEIKLYYPDADGRKLVAEKRSINTDQEDKYTASMHALLSGTRKKGSVNVIPAGTNLQSIDVSNGLATVSFSKDLGRKTTGGSTSEKMIVGSIVNTLTEFPEVKRVRILINHKSIDTLNGHMDLSEPFSRMSELL